jgi:hypothetical protein
VSYIHTRPASCSSGRASVPRLLYQEREGVSLTSFPRPRDWVVAMAVQSDRQVPTKRRGWNRSPPNNPDRPAIERQGKIVFWLTLGVAVLIVVIAVVYALVL